MPFPALLFSCWYYLSRNCLYISSRSSKFFVLIILSKVLRLQIFMNSLTFLGIFIKAMSQLIQLSSQVPKLSCITNFRQFNIFLLLMIWLRRCFHKLYLLFIKLKSFWTISFYRDNDRKIRIVELLIMTSVREDNRNFIISNLYCKI